MAIFGNFSDIPISDVFSLTVEDCGILRIWDCQHDLESELSLDAGYLTGFVYKGQPLGGALSVRERMASLVGRQEGEFEFVPQIEIRRDFALPINQLTLAGLSGLDLANVDSDTLPNENTLFLFAGEPTVWLGDELHDFLAIARTPLGRGTSGYELANISGCNMSFVLFALYRLRIVGVITPHRALEMQAGTVTEPKVRGIKRLRLENGIPQPQSRLHTAQIYRPQKTLLSWLLGKLKKSRNRNENLEFSNS